MKGKETVCSKCGKDISSRVFFLTEEEETVCKACWKGLEEY